MKYEVALVGIGLLAGAGGFWVGAEVKRQIPQGPPLRATEIAASYRAAGRWRVQEHLTSSDACSLMLVERRFKDDDLDKVIMVYPVDSDPVNVGGGIARTSLRRGERQAWAEYDIATSGLHRGVYSVVVTLAGCESDYTGTYALIPAVPYDFTGLDLTQPTAPSSPR